MGSQIDIDDAQMVNEIVGYMLKKCTSTYHNKFVYGMCT